MKGRNGDGGVVVGGGGQAVLGPDQPKQTSLWGWATCMGAIPMQPAASLPQAKGREGTEGQWQKDREGAPRGDDRDEKTPHTTGGESGGPWASKVATGEKWRSNTVNVAAKVLNEAPCGLAGTVQTQCPLLQEEQLQNNEDKYFYKWKRSLFSRLQSAVWGELSSIKRPTGEHLGVVGRRRDELNILWH